MSIIIHKRHFVSFLLIFITLALIIIFLITNNQQKTYRSKAQETISPAPEASPSAQIALLETVIESKNIETDTLIDKYEQSIDEGEKQNIVSTLENNLMERKNNLLSLLKLSPLSVYKKAFDKDKIEKLYKIEKIKNKKLVEERIDTLQGTVNTLHTDDFNNNISHEYATFIPDDNQDEEINFYPTTNQTFLSGTKVTVNNAIRIDKDKQVLGVSSSVYAQEQEGLQPQEQDQQPQSHLVVVEIEVIEAPSLDTLGEQKILILLAKAKDVDESQLPTPQEIGDRINGPIKQFYEKNSYGKIRLKADIIQEWHNINVFSSNKMFNAGMQGFDPYFLKFYKRVLKEVDPFLRKNNIDISQYRRLGLIFGLSYEFIKRDVIQSGEGLPTISGSGVATIGIYSKLNHRSLTYLFLPPKNIDPEYFKNSKYINIGGELSLFDKIFAHEFGHNLGAAHAETVVCNKNILTFSFDYDCALGGGYTNYFDIMGQPYKDSHFNAYVKKSFGWIGDYSPEGGAIIKISVNHPDGKYELKRVGTVGGVVGAWLPFATETNNNTAIDYFLEYRKGAKHKDQNDYGMLINIPGLDIKFKLGLERNLNYGTGFIHKTYLFSTEQRDAFPKDAVFIDRFNNIKIKVIDVLPEEDILRFTVRSCNKTLFNAIPHQAGSNQFIPSINIFENDLRGENNTTKPLTIKENFLIENTSACFNKKYFIDQSAIVINQGNLSLSTPQFHALSTEVAPSKSVDNAFTTIATINNPALPDTQLEFTVIEQNLDTDQTSNNNKEEQPISKKLIYQFHVVPSTEEYRNDLEPFIIDIKNKDTSDKEFNHLETEKGQTLVFTSKIANNSRNPDGNKSIDFFVKWEIQDEKGNNVIPPFRQRHDGIPPKTLDNANPAILTWTIPQDFKAGDYKIILEVDSNNRLQEFNENNNMIYRYFSVVE